MMSKLLDTQEASKNRERQPLLSGKPTPYPKHDPINPHMNEEREPGNP